MKKSLISALFVLFAISAVDTQAGGRGGMGGGMGGGGRGMGGGQVDSMRQQQQDRFQTMDQQRIHQHQNSARQYQDGGVQQHRETVREQSQIRQTAPAAGNVGQ